MAKYKIGITEAGDAGLDLSWVKKLDQVDGAILVTKRISNDFYDAALDHSDKLIIHATTTGYGHSVLEPNVPTVYEQFSAVRELVRGGFPKEKIVIRVDPIIPTEKGLNTALETIETFMEKGFTRYRISVIDMYPHVRERFLKAGLPLPYGPNGFSPSKDQLIATDAMLQETIEFWNQWRQWKKDSLNLPSQPLRIECCAEPGLRVPIQCGCVSGYDLQLLGLDPSDVDTAGPQRRNCMCYSGKTELLSTKHPCGHQCLYCYWRA